MKNKLQYAYSIAVFFGVLVTAYSMMSRDGSNRVPFQAFQSPGARTEASMVDPAVTSLFEMEDALNNIPGVKGGAKRMPTQSRPVYGVARKPTPKINPLPPPR
jgi:hypothetical protein